MSNHSSALPMVAAAICSAPLADFGVGGTSGSKVVVDTKVAGGYMRWNFGARHLSGGREQEEEVASLDGSSCLSPFRESWGAPYLARFLRDVGCHSAPRAL